MNFKDAPDDMIRIQFKPKNEPYERPRATSTIPNGYAFKAIGENDYNDRIVKQIAQILEKNEIDGKNAIKFMQMMGEEGLTTSLDDLRFDADDFIKKYKNEFLEQEKANKDKVHGLVGAVGTAGAIALAASLVVPSPSHNTPPEPKLKNQPAHTIKVEPRKPISKTEITPEVLAAAKRRDFGIV